MQGPCLHGLRTPKWKECVFQVRARMNPWSKTHDFEVENPSASTWVALGTCDRVSEETNIDITDCDVQVCDKYGPQYYPSATRATSRPMNSLCLA